MKSTTLKTVAGVVVFVALCGVLAVGAWWYLNRPAPEANNTAARHNAVEHAIPSLGSQGHPMQTPPTDQPGNNAPTVKPANDNGEPDNTQPEKPRENTAREIDIWLYNLGVATKARDRKGMAIARELLKSARPDKLVDERVRNALDNEPAAVVRIEFNNVFHAPTPKLDWATHVYGTRTAKFLGTDELYDPGEVQELQVICGELFDVLIQSWLKKETPDGQLMSLLRNLLDTEKPDWLFEQARAEVFLPAIRHEMTPLVQALQPDLKTLLQRRKVKREVRELFFTAYLLSFDPVDSVLLELESPQWWNYASALATWYEPRRTTRPRDAEPADWLAKLLAGEGVPTLFQHLLQGNMPADAKRLLIQRITDYDVPNGRKMIEDGLQRKDANYPDYLIALGSFASDQADLQRLTTAADDADVKIAQGAIEGLRRSGLKAADAELRKVLEQGANPGVKSLALGALLSRAADKTALLEEYLDLNKDPSLRAVAISGIPDSDLERLQKVVEEDPSLRVRQTALNRLGAIRPTGRNDRKKLRSWFVGIQHHDASMVIRSAARKYAEALKD